MGCEQAASGPQATRRPAHVHLEQPMSSKVPEAPAPAGPAHRLAPPRPRRRDAARSAHRVRAPAARRRLRARSPRRSRSQPAATTIRSKRSCAISSRSAWRTCGPRSMRASTGTSRAGRALLDRLQQRQRQSRLGLQRDVDRQAQRHQRQIDRHQRRLLHPRQPQRRHQRRLGEPLAGEREGDPAHPPAAAQRAAAAPALHAQRERRSRPPARRRSRIRRARSSGVPGLRCGCSSGAPVRERAPRACTARTPFARRPHPLPARRPLRRALLAGGTQRAIGDDAAGRPRAARAAACNGSAGWVSRRQALRGLGVPISM